MNCKSLLILLAVLFTVSAFSQAKVFRFNEIRSRNNQLQWEKPVRTEERLVFIAEDSIEVILDKPYRLTIISKTLLPNNGAIYLCKDQTQNEVTVTLVDDEKMFVYNDSKRFQVNFTESGFAPLLSFHSASSGLGQSFAETED